jgi:hypothetical protein
MEFSGILHVHSTYSYDGELNLAQLRALGERAGLRFMCMTEHAERLSPERAQAFIRECRERSDNSFLFIPGFETSQGNAHLLSFGTTLAILAHPHRSSFVLPACDGVEVWNAQYDGKRFPRWKTLQWFRRIARTRPELRALAGADVHRASHLGGPRLIVEAPALTEADILNALKSGAYRIKSRRAIVNSHGALLWPGMFVARWGSMRDVFLIRFVRFASRIAKFTGFSRTDLFRRFRERIRKAL